MLELESTIFSRLTFDGAWDSDPIWSPDGRKIVFSKDHYTLPKSDLYMIAPGEEEHLLFESDEWKWTEDWSKDGRFIIYTTGVPARAAYALPLSGDRKPRLLLETPFQIDELRLSPDGRWIAYGSTETGTWEVYVASFPEFKDKRQVSNTGGGQPLWRADGKESILCHPRRGQRFLMIGFTHTPVYVLLNWPARLSEE